MESAGSTGALLGSPAWRPSMKPCWGIGLRCGPSLGAGARALLGDLSVPQHGKRQVMTSTEHGGTSRKWSEDDLDLASSAGTVDPPIRLAQTLCRSPLLTVLWHTRTC